MGGPGFYPQNLFKKLGVSSVLVIPVLGEETEADSSLRLTGEPVWPTWGSPG